MPKSFPILDCSVSPKLVTPSAYVTRRPSFSWHMTKVLNRCCRPCRSQEQRIAICGTHSKHARQELLLLTPGSNVSNGILRRSRPKQLARCGGLRSLVGAPSHRLLLLRHGPLLHAVVVCAHGSNLPASVPGEPVLQVHHSEARGAHASCSQATCRTLKS